MSQRSPAKSLSENQNLLSQNLSDTLIEAIVSGQIAQGEKISEPELARHYGVSRGPLREAILKLQGMGLVERVPHVGARVVQLNQQQLLDIYSVREALEGMACRLAAEQLSTIQLDELKKLLEHHQSYLQQHQGKAYFEQQGDFDFHYLIIKGSANQRLVNLLCDELYHLLRMYRYQAAKQVSRPERALKEHWAIWQALADRDGELAEMLMRRHIARARKAIEQQHQTNLTDQSLEAQASATHIQGVNE
ncbi:GntR family transcriptional regulator [Agarivorans sp. 1_MG-2023]|uniref:GntR family transcriptional regulator n=1 Tax=Agarivorans sp. 1_MG-2023 TaxID=3062634 RepID=UPI0026E38052|nr:GntR family transcriptional regulator [Agarivorans sp. 1_MG-2023]MDO6765922.1 GntR family transcriptional regulator [Agarivorans sp. 1_MG-2023]